MTGGAFGSLFAQLFHLSANERKTLLVAGAAAGMAAVFATPVMDSNPPLVAESNSVAEVVEEIEGGNSDLSRRQAVLLVD